MEFEWDENKNRRNVVKHGIDFDAALVVFDGRSIFEYDIDHQVELRHGTVALIGEKHYLVIWTRRGERVRIISAYRADDWEIREYRRLHG